MFKKKDTKLIIENWRKFINENTEKELSKMDLRYIEMYKRKYTYLSEEVIKKVYIATQSMDDIKEYGLGYTNEDSWGDNLLSYLNEKVGINLQTELDESVFSRHVLSMMHEYSEMCRKSIARNYDLNSAIQEFLYEFLNKIYKIQ